MWNLRRCTLRRLTSDLLTLLASLCTHSLALVRSKATLYSDSTPLPSSLIPLPTKHHHVAPALALNSPTCLSNGPHSPGLPSIICHPISSP